MPFNNETYNVLWTRLVSWLTANELAKPWFLVLAKALISPISFLHTRLQYFRNYTQYRLSITSQVGSLEKLLNDRFDVVLRRIRIVKGIEFDPLVLFQKSENIPVTLNRKGEAAGQVFYTKGETAQFTVDFIVKVPVQVNFDLNELTAYLDIDVLPSKVYKVQIV